MGSDIWPDFRSSNCAESPFSKVRELSVKLMTSAISGRFWRDERIGTCALITSSWIVESSNKGYLVD